MKRSILRLLTREYDTGIIAREVIKHRHEPGQVRVKVKVRNREARRLAEACAVVTVEEIKAEECRYLQEQASQLVVEQREDGCYSVKNPESGSHYLVRKVLDGDQVIWDCNCLHFAKMRRRDCKHAIAAEIQESKGKG